MTFVGKFYPNPENADFLNQTITDCDLSAVPEVGRGIMEGIFPYRFNSPEFHWDEQEYINDITNFSQPWPTPALTEITEEEIQKFQNSSVLYYDCNLSNFYTIKYSLREIKANKYLPDLQENQVEAVQCNATHEYIAEYEQKIISHNCATDINISGPVLNNAWQID